MDTTRPPTNLLFVLFIIFSLASSSMQGFATQVVLAPHHTSLTMSSTITPLRELGLQEVWRGRKKRYIRRLLIGSTAPICTYNECRGCKFKCRAEQIPVDANDPINSAYHYRCVCHR